MKLDFGSEVVIWDLPDHFIFLIRQKCDHKQGTKWKQQKMLIQLV
jgi:hypothetical protein